MYGQLIKKNAFRIIYWLLRGGAHPIFSLNGTSIVEATLTKVELVDQETLLGNKTRLNRRFNKTQTAH